MWLLFLAGLLAVSVGEETLSSVTKETDASSGNADDIVMLEIDVKGPAKRSPVSATADYGSHSQYVVRHSDDAQELSPEYLSLLQQYTESQVQSYSPTSAPPPQRRPLPAYAKQQQELQQAYQNYRKPAVVPPRPPATLHPQALARAEAASQLQAQIEVQNRAEALRSARLGSHPSAAPTYQVPSYSSPKLGTFEQELLQLVSANQAQEFKLLPTQPKGSSSPYSQQLVSYPTEYAKSTAAPSQLPEQYHIETSPPRYHQPQAQANYQPVEEPVQVQYQSEYTKPVKPFRPSPQYDYVEENPQLKAVQQAHAQAEAAANAKAQARAEAQALAFQKVAQAAHNKHQQDAFEQIRIVNERYRQQSALEQIQEGSQVSEAGRTHIEEQVHPKDPEAAYRARLKAQAAAEVAEARRVQEASEFKAHADAIRNLQAQQQAHVKAQEDAHNYALNFERNQVRAQAQAQAIAQAQAEALYKVHQQNRAKANSEAQAIARAQAEARKADPENTPVVQYLLPNSQPLPSPNSYFTNDDTHKYQGSATSYVPRSVPKTEGTTTVEQEQAYLQPIITQPRQTNKLKIPPGSQSSVYVSDSGLLKKSPVKSLTIEEVVEQDQINSPQVVRIPTPKGQILTEEDLSALINAGYTVTPVPETVKPIQQTYVVENTSVGHYPKKDTTPVSRPEYVTYEEIQRPRRPLRKSRPILKQDEGVGDASEKVTYLVPLEPSFGTRQPTGRHE